PRSVIFVNALVQARGKAPLQAPTKELDPFYTWGGLYQKNGWTFSASTTFVQNFREPFHHNATIPKNSYVLISDFEVARRVMKQYPGLQAFVRAEPIWNFHSHNTPSLSGMDFRLFFGFRFAMAKQALTSTLMQIREQLQETDPGQSTPSTSKPSASLPIENSISLNPQPIHGFLDQNSLAETCMSPSNDAPEIASKDSGTKDAENTNTTEIKDQTTSIANAQKELLSNASNSTNAHAVTLSSLDKVENAPVIDISKAVANANSTAERTLEAIANASSADFSKNTQSEQAKILDLTTAPIDWHELESASTQLVAVAADQVAFNSMINQVAEESNTIAQEERANKIKTLAEKQEREFKIALVPVMPNLPTRTVNQNQFQIKPPVAQSKLAQAALPQPKAIKPEQMFAPQTLSADKVAPQSQLNLPQPSALKATQFAFNQTKPVEKAPQAVASMPELKELDLRASSKQVKPLHQASESVASHNGIIPPSVISSEKLAIEPVPMVSKAVVAPNKIPAPVSAKLPAPTGILPSSKTVDKALLAEKSMPTEKAAASTKLASKNGIIPLSELKVEKASEPKQVIASVFNPQVSAPSITAIPSIAAAKTTVAAQTLVQTVKPTPVAAPSLTATTSPAAVAVPSLTATTKPAVVAAPSLTATTRPAVVAAPSLTATSRPAVVAAQPATVKQVAPRTQTVASSISSVRPLDNIRPSRSTTDFAKPMPAAPVLQPDNSDDNMLAVSGLDSDISSPKIAMAVYDNWQSPVLDDPLISSGQAQTSNELNIPELKSHSTSNADDKRKAEKKRTDMKLIPPFPTVGSKDNPLKDLQIPVLPH
ncbi:MAG: hypothetical protein K2X81_29580, partial [Candidatus Obscuribacterales bacterium]|nr:hypothetical protein [Candidatus Obscuribacterales bacterium]